MTTTKTALVTGASSGIGEATALRLFDLGYVVYGAARRTGRLERLAAAGIQPLTMDITDDQSMDTAVKSVIAATGRIDVLVNNAGYGSYGALEDVPLAEARHQFEVNVFGTARLTQLVLPHMRAQRSGTIVNVTSMGGKFYTPMGGWYHSSKFALEALSDCLRLEAKPFGVKVVVVEPGAIETEWFGIAADNLKKVSATGPYAKLAGAMVAMLDGDTDNRHNSPPSVIADAIGKAVTARRPKIRYVTGYAARPLLLLRRILPDRAFDALITRVTGTRG